MVISRPKAIQHILVANADNYVRPTAAVRVLDGPLGGGLFLAEGAEWRRQRRLLAPAFTPRSTADLTGPILRITATMLATLRDGPLERVPLFDWLQALTMTITATTLLGIDLAPHEEEVQRLATRYKERLVQADLFDFLLPRWVPSPRDLARRRFRRSWLALFDRIVADRRQSGSDPARDAPDADGFFPRLDRSETPRGLLTQQVSTLLVTGSETTGAALFWSVYLLASAPRAIQDRIAAEAAAAGLGEDNEPGSGILDRLPSARAVVHEAMRLYPPALSIVRRALAPDEADGISIPAGTIVQVAPWVLHRHRRHWDRPDTFDPDRFMPGAPSPERYTYLPFGIGPRQCIGAGLALVEATLVLAMLLRRFEITPTTEDPVLPVAQITLQPHAPPPFRLTPRDASAACGPSS